MDYLNPWTVAALAGICCLGFFFLLTRRIPYLLPRMLLRCLGAVWLLLPAPVPDYPGHYAPAYIVWLFEGVLKSNGDPGLSLRILLWSSLAVVVLILLWYLGFGRHRAQRSDPSLDPSSDPAARSGHSARQEPAA